MSYRFILGRPLFLLLLSPLLLLSDVSGSKLVGERAIALLKGHTDSVDTLAISRDGKLLASGSLDKTIKLWDLAANKELRSCVGHQGQVLSVGFSPKGDLLVSGAADNTAKIWEVSNAKVNKNLPHPNLVDAVAFDETGTLVATGCHDGNLRIWDVAKATAVKSIAAHIQTMPQNIASPIYCVAWAPGGKQILTASYDKSMKLWDATSGNLVKEFRAASEEPIDPKMIGPRELPGHRDQVFAAAFSKDGHFIASGSSDRTIKLWNVASGQVIRDFPSPDIRATIPGEAANSHIGWVHALSFTANDRYLVSVGTAPRYRGQLAVWSVADGKRLAVVDHEAGPIHCLAITPDGSKLIIGCGLRSRSSMEADIEILEMPVK